MIIVEKKRWGGRILLAIVLTVLLTISASAQVSITTAKDKYIFGQEVKILISGDTTDLYINLETPSAHLKYLGELGEFIIYTPTESGSFSATLMNGFREEIAKTSFDVYEPDWTEKIVPIEKFIELTSEPEIIVAPPQKVINKTNTSNQTKTAASISKPLPQKKQMKKYNVLGVRNSDNRQILSRIKIYKDKTEVFDSYYEDQDMQEGEYDIEIDPSIPNFVKVMLDNVNITKDFKIGIERLNKQDRITNKKTLEAFAIDPTTVDFKTGIVTRVAVGSELWKCKDWNFTLQFCFGTWKKIKDIVPGTEYNITIDAFDPAFLESNQSDFDKGTYNRTFFNASGFIQLNATFIDGTFTSQIFNTSTNSSWVNFTWVSNAIGELPNNLTMETKFGNGSANMTGNLLLLHMNDTGIGHAPGGADVRDFSSRGHNGVQYGGVTFNASGRFGNAINFDEVDDYINISDFDYGPAFTLMFWAKVTDNIGSSFQFFFSHGAIGTANSLNIYVTEDSQGGDVLRTSLGDVANQPGIVGLDASPDDLIADGNWTHYALTVASADTRVFIDGQQQVSNGGGGAYDPTTNVFLGAREDLDGSRFLGGEIDEVVIFNRTLSPTEVLNLYKRGALRLNLSVRSCDDASCTGEVFTNINDTSPQTLNLINNTHFQYRFKFETDNVTYSPQLYNVTIDYLDQDIFPPGSVTGLANQSSGTTWIYTNWTNPSDSDFNESIIFVNGSNVANTSNNFFNGTGLNPGTSYVMTIHTKDHNGNINDTDVNGTAFTLPDIKSPTVNYTSPTPANDSTITVSTFIVNVTHNEELPHTIVLYVDSSVNQTRGYSGPYTNFTVSAGAGNHTYYVFVNDTSGNSNKTLNRTINIDLSGPGINLEAPSDNAYQNSNSVIFYYNVTDDTFSINNCSIIIGGIVNQTNTSITETTSLNFTVSNFADGAHSWNVNCTNNVGTEGTSSVRTINIDTTNPIANLTNITPNPAQFENENVTVNWTATDANIDTSFANVTYPNGTLLGTFSTDFILTIFNLSQDGTYTITAFASDLAGNTNTTIRTLAVNDVAPPIITLISPIDDSGDPDTEANFIFNVTDHNNIENCSLMLQGSTNTTNTSVNKGQNTTFTVENLATDKYNWSVTCWDTQGNQANSPERNLDVILMAFGGQTTDITSVNISNIAGFTIDNPAGRILFTQNVDLSGGADLSSAISIENNHISLNSTLVPALNVSANLTITGLTYSFPPVVFADGVLCDPSVCGLGTYNGANFTFNVSHFTAYSSSSNSQLGIWDETDPEGGNLEKYLGDDINFFANYTNTTSGVPITTAECNITFEDIGPFTMTYNATSTVYDYNRSFNSSGLKDWNVTCDDTPNDYEIVTVNDIVAVRPIDFFVQRGFASIPVGQTGVTIEAGNHYTAPENITKAFVRIIGTRLTGIGNDAGGGNQDADEFMASIEDPENLLTSITFRRFSSTGTFDTRIYWEIIEYTGTSGGDNEIIVRDQAQITQTTDASMNGSAIASVSDDNDVVVFITGQRHDAGGDTTATDRGLYTSEWIGAQNIPRVTRGDGTGTSSVSYAVVEFTGSNWVVQRAEHPYGGLGEEREAITPVNSVDRTFIHPQIRTASGNLDEMGQRAWLSSTDNVSFELGTGGVFSRVGVAWVIENTQISGETLNTQRFVGTRASGGAEPDQWNEGMTSVSRFITTSVMGETATSTGTGSANPRGSIGFEITELDNVTLWRSDTGQTQVYRFEVVEWPTSPTNFEPTKPTNITCNGNDNCDIEVDKSVLLKGTGAIDVEGDNITYFIEATLGNDSSSSNTNNVRFYEETGGQRSVNVHVNSTELATISTTSTTIWTDIATIPSTDLSPNTDYLLYASFGMVGAATGTRCDFRLVEDAGIIFTGLVEPAGTADDAKQQDWARVYTTDETPGNFILQFNVQNSGTCRSANSQIMMLDLSELTQDEDWYYYENTTAFAIGTAATETATVILDSANGTKDWFVISNVYQAVDATNAQFNMDLYSVNNTDNDMRLSVEGEDGIEQLTWTVFRTFDDVAKNEHFSTRVSVESASAHAHTSSSIFALNLDAFESHDSVYLDGSVALPAALGQIAALVHTPTTSGNQLIFSGYMADTAAAGAGWEDEVTITGTVNPAGWDWTQAPPVRKTAHDATDIWRNNIFSYENIADTGETISLRAADFSSAAVVDTEHTINAFSQALAGGAKTDENGSYTTYNDIGLSFVSLTNVTITIEVDSYNPGASVDQGTRKPDLELGIYNGSEFVVIGLYNLNLTYTGSSLNTTNVNFSLTTTNPTILSAWETTSNQDFRIRGRFLDHNNSVPDEINITNVFISGSGSSWQEIGNHSENESLNWNTSSLVEQTCVNLRTRAIDLDGSNSYTEYFTKGNCLNISHPTNITATSLNTTLLNQTQGVRLNATITDTDGVIKANATILYPNGSSENITMTKIDGELFSVDFSNTNQTGLYSFTNIYTLDTNENLIKFTFSTLTFTVTLSPPTAFNLSLPANATESSNLIPNLSWGQTNEPHFNNYTILLDKDINFGSPDFTYYNTPITNLSRVVTFALDANSIYYWRVIAFDVFGANKTANEDFIYITDTIAPGVTLNTPVNDTFVITNSVTFNYTPTDTNTLANCTLYGNFSGSFQENVTNTSITKSQSNFLTTNVNEGEFLWNVLCTDNAGNSGFAAENYTVRVDFTGPDIDLQAPPNGTFENVTNNINFTANATDFWTGIGSCELIVDGVPQATETSITEGANFTFTDFVLNGNHTWNVNCTDDNGIESSSVTYNITVLVVDNDPPLITLNYPDAAEVVSSSNILFNYTPEDATGIQNCSLFIDNALNQTNLTVNNFIPNYFDVSGFSEALYEWRVDCYDNSTEFNFGASETRNFTVDLTNPSVVLNRPLDDTFSTISSVNFNYTPTDSSLDACIFYGNFSGSFVQELTNNTPASGIPNIFSNSYNDGRYIWNVLCNDTAGRSSFAASNFTIKIDTTAPAYSNNLTDPISPATYAPGQLYVFNITWIDNFAVHTVLIENNFTGTMQNQTVTSGNNNYSFNISNLDAGSYVFKWHANDTVGTENQTQFYSYIINKAPSEINLLLNSTDGNFSMNEDRTANATANMVTPSSGFIEIFIDGTLMNNGSSPVTNISLYPEPGVFNITAVYPETLNYLESRETHFLIVNDTTLPIVRLISPENDTFAGSNDINFFYNVSDSSTILNCSLYINGSFDQANTSVVKDFNMRFFKNLDDGNYTWQVRCYDAAENLGVSDIYNLSVLKSDFIVVQVTTDKPTYERGEIVNISTHTEDVFGVGMQTNVTTDIILANTSLGWWNTSWQYRKPILTSHSLSRQVIKIVEVNITGLAGNISSCTNEIRIVRNDSAVNTVVPSEILSGDDNDHCVVKFSANMSANAQNEISYHAYYGNPTAPDPGTSSGLGGIRVIRADISNTGTTLSDTIPSVNTSKAFILFTSNTVEVDPPDLLQFTPRFGSSTQVAFDRYDGATSADIAYQVIEHSDITVQRNEEALTSGTASVDVDITEVNMSRSFIVVDGRTSSGTASQNNHGFFRGYFLNSTAIRLERGTTGTTATVAWQVVEWKGARVQRGSQSFATVSATYTINSTNLTRSFVIFNRGSVSDDSLNTNMIQGRLIDETNVFFTKNTASPATTTSLGWYVVELPEEFVIQNGTSSGSADRTVALTNQVIMNRTFHFQSWHNTGSGTAYGNTRNKINLTDNQTLVIEKQSTSQTSAIAWYVMEELEVSTATISNDAHEFIARNSGETTAGGDILWEYYSINLTPENYSAVSVASRFNFTSGTDATIFEIVPDTTPPNVTLLLPVDNHTQGSGFINFTYVPFDTNLGNCTLHFGIGDGFSGNATNTTPLNNQNNTFLNTFFNVGIHQWNVKCNDTFGNAAFAPLNFTLNITGPDFIITFGNITFSNEPRIEGVDITVFANISNIGLSPEIEPFVAQFFLGDPEAGGTQINGNITISNLTTGETIQINITHTLQIGLNRIYVLVDGNNTINESDENNNVDSNNVTVELYQFIYGNVSSGIVLGSGPSDVLINFTNFTGSGNVFVADSDSAFNFVNLQALTRTIGGSPTANDFTDADTNLGSGSYSDSIIQTWGGGTETPIATTTFIIVGSNVANVPIVNSTNVSAFVTGILWDTGDDDTNNQYDTTDDEDLIFATKINLSEVGRYGLYDYEIRVPALLRNYTGSSETIDIFVELV